MAFFAIVGKAEATQEAGCRSLDNEKRKRPWRFDKKINSTVLKHKNRLAPVFSIHFYFFQLSNFI